MTINSLQRGWHIVSIVWRLLIIGVLSFVAGSVVLLGALAMEAEPQPTGIESPAGLDVDARPSGHDPRSTMLRRAYDRGFDYGLRYPQPAPSDDHRLMRCREDLMERFFLQSHDEHDAAVDGCVQGWRNRDAY